MNHIRPAIPTLNTLETPTQRAERQALQAQRRKTAPVVTFSAPLQSALFAQPMPVRLNAPSLDLPWFTVISD